MKFIKITLYAVILLMVNSMMAQQDPNYTLYRYNMNLINPAYVGTTEDTELGVNIRSQWSNVEGAPETQSVFFGTKVNENIGLGVSIISDKTFIEKQTSVSVDFSYRLRLGTETDFYFGIKAGANSYRANTFGLITFGIGSDPALTNLDGEFSPNIGAGVYLKGEEYFVSFSVPRILTQSRLENNNGLVKLGDERVYMYLAGGYDFSIGKGVVFKPSALVRYIDTAPLSLDLTAAFLFNQRFELGASYRLDEGVGGLVLFNAAEWIDIGYGYETSLESQISSISSGTHEIFMKFKF